MDITLYEYNQRFWKNKLRFSVGTKQFLLICLAPDTVTVSQLNGLILTNSGHGMSDSKIVKYRFWFDDMVKKEDL